MLLLRPTFVVLFFIGGLVPLGHAQEEETFPTDNEIQLLLTQADRAMKFYKPSIDEEELWFGNSGAEAVAKDRQAFQVVEIAVETLKKQPQGFNSPAGFALFEWLDDADRNALLCSSQALSQASLHMMAGDTGKADGFTQLSKSCMDAAALIYTVSENAGSLYLRYTKAEQHLAEKGLSVSQKCAEALKTMRMAAEKKK